MSAGQTVRLVGEAQRELAKRLIDRAPPLSIVNIKPETRSNEQNSLFWALLSDISRAKPEGRRHSPEIWKCLFMSACGHAVQFENGLNGQPFPVGFRSSRLSKSQMSDLIECAREYAARHSVLLSEPQNNYA